MTVEALSPSMNILLDNRVACHGDLPLAAVLHIVYTTLGIVLSNMHHHVLESLKHDSGMSEHACQR